MYLDFQITFRRARNFTPYGNNFSNWCTKLKRVELFADADLVERFFAVTPVFDDLYKQL
jgi:hypothetical protein